MNEVTPPRPNSNSPEVLKRNMIEFYDELLAWSVQTYNHYDYNDILNNKDSWVDILVKEYSSDGFSFAKNIERYLSPDAALVELLDGIWIDSDPEVKQWVIDNNITPKYQLGNHIHFTWGNKKYWGDISKIDLELGTYSIPDENYKQGSRSFIVAYENVIDDGLS